MAHPGADVNHRCVGTTLHTSTSLKTVVDQTIGTTVTAFAYDGFGNLTSAGTAASTTTAYAYDLGDRLVSLTAPGSTATTFTYDALGRIATRSLPGAGTDTYSYVGLSEDAWQISNGAALTGSLLAPDGSRLSVLDGTSLAWTIPDLHGSVAATTDTADALSSALRYDGYGQTQSSWTAAGPLPSPWRYQGRLELSPDAANPLYENGARSYSPGLGAFTQLDSYTGSAQNPLSLNRYLYAEANPATLIDPSGHFVQQGPDGDLADSHLAAGTGGGQQAPVYQAPAYQPPPSGPPRSGQLQGTDPGVVQRTLPVSTWTQRTTDEYNSLSTGAQDYLASVYGPAALLFLQNPAVNPWDFPYADAIAEQYIRLQEFIRGSPQYGGRQRAILADRYAAHIADYATSYESNRDGNDWFYFAAIGLITGAGQEVGDRVGGTVRATNGRGLVVSRPSTFRTATVQEAWDNATVGPNGGRICSNPTCQNEVFVAPGTGRRDWDVHHSPEWSDRTFVSSIDRAQVLDNYQRGTMLSCITCNRSRMIR